MAPVMAMVLAVAMNEKGDVMTSSPEPMLCARSAACSAVVPLEVAMAWDVPMN